MPGSQQLNCSFNVATCVDECPPGVLPSEPHHSQLLDLRGGKILLYTTDSLHSIIIYTHCTTGHTLLVKKSFGR